MIDINSIRQRAEAATLGPWDIRYGGVSDSDEGYGIASRVGDPRMVAECWPCTTNLELRKQLRADAQFIAAARTDIPALCDEIELLRTELAELRERYEPYEQSPEQRADHRLDRDGVLIVPGDELEVLDTRSSSWHPGQIVSCVGYRNGEIETHSCSLSWKGSRFRIVGKRVVQNEPT